MPEKSSKYLCFFNISSKKAKKTKGFSDFSQLSPAQPSSAQPSSGHPSPAQPSSAQHRPAQPSPAQPSPAQPSSAQPSPAQLSPAGGAYAHPEEQPYELPGIWGHSKHMGGSTREMHTTLFKANRQFLPVRQTGNVEPKLIALLKPCLKFNYVMFLT